MERTIGTYIVDDLTIEYSIVGKEAEPILMMHGGHSNCYEEFGYKSLVQSEFMIITPSRAGYGKTSHEIGESVPLACAYYVQLLNHLGIEKVHIIAVSAGGPSGLYFASRYPEKVKTLTLQSAVTKQWHTPQDNIYKAAHVLFHPFLEKGIWKLTSSMSNQFPTFIFKQMASSFSLLPFREIKDKMLDDDIEQVRRMNNQQRSGRGFLIDLTQTAEITTKDLNAIISPTFIMHSEHDAAVPLAHAHYSSQHIPQSSLCVLDTWGHLIWLGKGSEIGRKKLTQFLKKHI